MRRTTGCDVHGDEHRDVTFGMLRPRLAHDRRSQVTPEPHRVVGQLLRRGRRVQNAVALAQQTEARRIRAQFQDRERLVLTVRLADPGLRPAQLGYRIADHRRRQPARLGEADAVGSGPADQPDERVDRGAGAPNRADNAALTLSTSTASGSNSVHGPLIHFTHSLML